MILFPAALVIGFVGGFAVGAGVYGPWRRRLLMIWMALPFMAWSIFLLLGLASTGAEGWHEAIGWWLIGLFGYVGLPMLFFAGGGLFGFAVAPAPRRKWRLRDWRLPQ